MMNKFRLLTIACSILMAFSCHAQSLGIISDLTPREPIRDHYKDLREFSSVAQKETAWMDTIVYPPSLYKNNTMLFALNKPAYLTSDQVDFLVSSVNFPSNSSIQVREELDFLLDLQAKRTPKQIERVLEIAKIGYWPDAGMLASHPYYEQNLKNLFFVVREVMGAQHIAQSYPKTTKLLQEAMVDMRLMEFAIKYQLLRARPYQLEKRLEPLKKISSPSFASGHTLWAYVQAYIMAELIPEKRTAFLEMAYEIGFSRELMGVHYPSDEEAARQLAHRMIRLMWNTKTFQEDFTNAKQEWR